MRLEDEIKQSKFQSERHKMALNIAYTAGWLNVRITRRLKPHGLSPQQFNILRILRGQHPKSATVNLLTERMLDKTSNASRLVEKLRAKGWVERTVCQDDRRAVDVVITQKGLDLLAKIDKLQKEWQKETDPLTEAEARTVNLLLDKLRG